MPHSDTYVLDSSAAIGYLNPGEHNYAWQVWVNDHAKDGKTLLVPPQIVAMINNPLTAPLREGQLQRADPVMVQRICQRACEDIVSNKPKFVAFVRQLVEAKMGVEGSEDQTGAVVLATLHRKGVRKFLVNKDKRAKLMEILNDEGLGALPIVRSIHKGSYQEY